MSIFDRKRDGERGIALISALMITAILVVLVADFIFKMHIATARAGNFKDSARAGQLAGDGVVLAKAALEELLRRDPALVTDENGLVFARPAGEGLTVEIRATDEMSRLSARIAYPLTGQIEAKADAGLRRLLKALKLEEGLADSLADWIDNNSDPRAYGAEESYYKTLKAPYKPRGGYIETLDELLLVKGYTPDVFMAVNKYITPYSQDGLVNINTAPRPVLMALSDEMTEALANEIIKRRKEAPFRARSDIMKVPGFEKLGFSLQDKITITSRTYRIFSRGRSGEVVREVEAVVQTGGKVLYWREM